MIAVDMRKRDRMYQDMIDEDLHKLEKMGMKPLMIEINGELAKRLSGNKDEEGVDDQLVTNALNLTEEEYS
jgi:hypothetical protein